MFRQVIPKVLQNILPVNNVRTCTNVTDMALEKTVNQVTLLGRVGGDPQQRGNQDHPVVLFSVATHTNYKYMNGDFMQRTEWHKVCVFKPSLRELVVNYLTKGQRVMVRGKLSYGEFKDEEGKMKSTTAVIADEVIFLQKPDKQ
ncbi:mitochondrial single stranded DNA-binding protein [Calliopsis andreniformis]|uniref:mitochondrial single stranded DNA-binding protein n=1 Tax=Calliopsis andreniformis TaxID=337506 RepID=UPI003FCD4704